MLTPIHSPTPDESGYREGRLALHLPLSRTELCVDFSAVPRIFSGCSNKSDEVRDLGVILVGQRVLRWALRHNNDEDNREKPASLNQKINLLRPRTHKLDVHLGKAMSASEMHGREKDNSRRHTANP